MDSLRVLLDKGVKIPNPESVEIGDDIDVDRISGDGVTIYSGCKLYGRETFIGDGAAIGFEGPATIKNCYLGPSVALNGGFFEKAAFLEKSSCGLGSHVRQGTILEEEANIAHTVGLKQTILFPYVTLGSLINFCDCLMAGGTSRKNHSEVGSSYIHFNYTPNQDKATASLIGEVTKGVMLNQSPIFLGGQGGLVGPCRIAYGTIVAAGCICRKDQMREGNLVMEGGPRTARIPFKPGGYRNLKRVLDHNYHYIGHLLALWQWYEGVRELFIGPGFPRPLADGLKKTLKLGIDERIRQLGRLRDKVEESVSTNKPEGLEHRFCAQWDLISGTLTDLQAYQGSQDLKEQFARVVEKRIQRNGKNYTRCIKSMEADQTKIGTLWLQSIVDHVADQVALIMNPKQ
ncbi:MAG: protein GlmU [Desulfobacteraceae bacterium]|jgi:UDP-N-acetylglucosamine/UDP-N-acetylgalactosamine diphosphorylase